MRRFALTLAVLGAVLAFGYWYGVENSTPSETTYSFRLGEMREAARATPEERPVSISTIRIGEASAPGFIVGNGLTIKPATLAFTSFVIGYESGTSIVIEAPADRDIVENVMKGTFHAAAYAELLDVMTAADQIYVTHEHLDHVSVISRHPLPEAIASRLRLNKEQIAELPRYADDGDLPPPLRALVPETFPDPRRVAPGVAALATPGHTPGHLTFYVQLANGREYLMIGDIAWRRSNVADATTRPRFLQQFFFDEPEDRAEVQAQIRALHDLSEAEPDLVILPAHDAEQQDRLAAAGLLRRLPKDRD